MKTPYSLPKGDSCPESHLPFVAANRGKYRPLLPQYATGFALFAVAVGIVLFLLLTSGCSAITGSNVVHTDTIVGLRIRTMSDAAYPDISAGLIRSSTIISPTNEIRRVALGTDAEHMGWNRSKVHHAVEIGGAESLAVSPTFWDPFRAETLLPPP